MYEYYPLPHPFYHIICLVLWNRYTYIHTVTGLQFPSLPATLNASSWPCVPTVCTQLYWILLSMILQGWHGYYSRTVCLCAARQSYQNGWGWCGWLVTPTVGCVAGWHTLGHAPNPIWECLKQPGGWSGAGVERVVWDWLVVGQRVDVCPVYGACADG